MSAKPIVVIRVDLERFSPPHYYSDLVTIFSEKMPDYHVFIVPNDDLSEPHDLLEFQVFYEKDQQPIDFEQLKKLITDSIKQDTKP